MAYRDFARTYYWRDGQPTSEFTDMMDVVKDAASLYGRHTVSDFGPVALKAVRQLWVNRGYVRRRINQKVNRLRRIIKWGVENELVPPGILHGLQAVQPLKERRTPAPESQPVESVSEEIVRPVLQHVSRQVAAMIQLQLLTGMRPGEVVLIRPGDVDRREDVWIYRPQRHKTDYQGHERLVFLGPQAQDVLRPFLDRHASGYCFSPAEAEQERLAKRKATRKTPGQDAGRRRRERPKKSPRDHYDRDSYRRAILYGIKKAGVPHWHPHQLRHTCGTRVREEHGLDAAQVILGHRSARVTEVYASVSASKGQSVARQFG
ncbi:tyrosine-type recombinase/integrase [Planctomyces sp. SH-PL14]|uniref:tyrosine-type recombinase/integrase n=1 Tax=Planctomyces sp. SH-PL14 TaxID=1632864 RepID=UPI0012E6FCA7|nr:site-specific integrase [Planctomyces sp. SH-PL14]